MFIVTEADVDAWLRWVRHRVERKNGHFTPAGLATYGARHYKHSTPMGFQRNSQDTSSGEVAGGSRLKSAFNHT